MSRSDFKKSIVPLNKLHSFGRRLIPELDGETTVVMKAKLSSYMISMPYQSQCIQCSPYKICYVHVHVPQNSAPLITHTQCKLECACNCIVGYLKASKDWVRLIAMMSTDPYITTCTVMYKSHKPINVLLQIYNSQCKIDPLQLFT